MLLSMNNILCMAKVYAFSGCKVAQGENIDKLKNIAQYPNDSVILLIFGKTCVIKVNNLIAA